MRSVCLLRSRRRTDLFQLLFITTDVGGGSDSEDCIVITTPSPVTKPVGAAEKQNR